MAGPSARGYRSDRNRNRTPGWNRTTACGFGDRRPTIGPPAYMVRVPHGQRTTVPCVSLPSRPIATPLDGHNNAARQAGHTGPHPKPSTGVPVGCLAGGAGFEPATYGSKDRRAAKLHHPPICRFARPPTRWTPPAGPDVTDTARHCDHPQTLAVPRQSGCRGAPPHGSGARRVPHARRVAYLAYPPGIRTWISTHRGRRAAITPTGHSHPNQTGCKAGMPDSISPAAPRYGVRKLRFKRTVRWVTNPAVKPGRALPSIP